MYTDEQFEQLEQEERSVTDDALVAMALLITTFGDDIIRELRNFFQKYGKDGVVTYSEARKWVSEKDHRRRWTVLTLLIGERFSSLLDELEFEFETFLLDVVDKESSFFGVDIDTEKVLLTLWGADKLNWLIRLQDHANLWEYYITSDIKKALLQRKNIEDIVEELTERCASMKRVLSKLGLTESTAIGSAARQEIFKTLGISQYRFYTKYDERTCETCGAMHGQVFPMSAYEIGVTASPMHPNCRCFEVPIYD